MVFRAGAFDELAAETARLGERALILTTPGHAALGERAQAALGARAAGHFAGARLHVPTEIAARAIAQARLVHADCCVALGGGSTTGLAKAIALELALPILVVPTTYAGSEMTPIWGLTDARTKRTGRDARALPRTVLYDPVLTLDLPVAVSVASGLNAMAHAVEGLYAQSVSPLTSLMAEESIRAFGKSLPAIAAEPKDLAARSEALCGAWLAGTILGSVGMALHHKLCHVLGGSFDLGHAETHTIVLPHAVAYNAAAAPQAMSRIERALGVRDAAQGLYDFARALGARMALKDIGMPADAIDRAVTLATERPYYNPAPLDPLALRRLIENAYEGRRPQERSHGESH